MSRTVNLLGMLYIIATERLSEETRSFMLHRFGWFLGGLHYLNARRVGGFHQVSHLHLLFKLFLEFFLFLIIVARIRISDDIPQELCLLSLCGKNYIHFFLLILIQQLHLTSL